MVSAHFTHLFTKVMSDDALRFFEQESAKVTDHLKAEFAKLQTGRASAAMVEHLQVEMYGAHQPLKNIASVSIPDSKTISIQPWDKTAINAIDKAIQLSGLGINPSNNGESIILNIPAMSEERRKDLVKFIKKMAEDSKVSLRVARQKTLDKIKAADLPEDMVKGQEKRLQELVDAGNKLIEEHIAKKEQEILTI